MKICHIFTLTVKYDFSKLDYSGNCIIRKTCCIVLDLKKKYRLNEVIPHGTKSVNCHLGLQHFNTMLMNILK